MSKGIYKHDSRYDYNTALFLAESEVKYYLLGLILADGYISNGRGSTRNSHRIELGLKESDKGFLEMIRDMVCPAKPLKYKQAQKAYRLTIDNVDIYNEVCRFVNELPKSTSLIFPYGIPDAYLLHFIRGYSDGDGNIGVKYGRRKLADGTRAKYFGLRYRILGTRQFLLGVEFNLRRVGAAINQVKPHRKGHENLYYIEYGFASAKRVLSALYQTATICLDRKRRVFDKISDMDSVALERAYGTPEGRYNTPGAYGEGIVGAAGKPVDLTRKEELQGRLSRSGPCLNSVNCWKPKASAKAISSEVAQECAERSETTACSPDRTVKRHERGAPPGVMI